MKTAYTHARNYQRYINKSHIFPAAVMFFQWSRAFAKVISLSEDFVINITITWQPFSFPDNVCSFIYQRPPKIEMIKQHKRSRFIAAVHNFIMNAYGCLSNCS